MTMNRRDFLRRSFTVAAGAALAITVNESAIAAISKLGTKDTLTRLTEMWVEIEAPGSRINFIQLGDDAFDDLWKDLYKHIIVAPKPRHTALMSFQNVPFKCEKKNIPADHIKMFINASPWSKGEFRTVSRGL